MKCSVCGREGLDCNTRENLEPARVAVSKIWDKIFGGVPDYDPAGAFECGTAREMAHVAIRAFLGCPQLDQRLVV